VPGLNSCGAGGEASREVFVEGEDSELLVQGLSTLFAPSILFFCGVPSSFCGIVTIRVGSCRLSLPAHRLR